MSHEITNTISDRESPEISLKDSNNDPDYELALNKEKQDALVLEVQGLKQNKEPKNTPDIPQEKENLGSDEEKALMAKNERIKEKETLEV